MILRARYAARPKGEFGVYVSNRLDELNMTQYEMANVLKISSATVSKHLSHVSKPTLPYVLAYSIVLRTDYSDLQAMVERDWA